MNIFITYDFLTTDAQLGKHLCSNLSFLKTILSALDINVHIDDRSNKQFDRSVFLQLLNLSDNKQRFQTFTKDAINNDALAMIKSYTLEYDLLLCYELSLQTRELFNILDIPYIDIWMAPIRFDKDIMFSFASNKLPIHSALQNYSYDETKFYHTAQKICKQFKYFKKNDFTLKKNSLLLVGQLFNDKAVIKNGKFLNLLDYKDEIKKLSREYSMVYFQKHPLMNEDEFNIYFKAFSEIKNISYLENANIYSLLAQEQIQKVVAISSSVLQEAKFFGKEVLYLYKPVLDENYITVFKEYYKLSFWQDVLNLYKNNNDVEYLHHDNFLRYEFNAFYAYETFIQRKQTKQREYDAMVKIFATLQALDKTQEYILYGYGSIGKLIAPHIPNMIGVIDKALEGKQKRTENCSLLQIQELLKERYNKAWVIISPFLFEEEIRADLTRYSKNIISLL